LKTRNAGSNDWKEFSSVSCVTPFLNGGANVSEMYSRASGSSGLTVRTFDVQKKQWLVHYIGGKTGQLDPGMIGGFDGNQGQFFGEDVDNGLPIKAGSSGSRSTMIMFVGSRLFLTTIARGRRIGLPK
jgi:hypothetical protein